MLALELGPPRTKVPFNEFFQLVTGHEPFAWQSRLADRVLAGRDLNWPGVCALPTGAGKTAVVLIGLYAMSVHSGAQRRIGYVVDRRIVVDGTYNTLQALQQRIADDDPMLRPWVAQLRSTCGLSAPEPSLEIHLLRGGLGEPLARLRSPLLPTIMVSTIDQLGSRLLFRGYGSSARSWPIAAGLLAHDTLWIVDEAHISLPFSQTLASVQNLTAHGPSPRPMAVVELTATPRPSQRSVFRLGPPCAALRPRLEASKPATVVTVEKQGDLAAAVAAAVKAEFAAKRKRIGVIVNRLRTARSIFAAAQRTYGAKANVVLLQGPIRAYDRRELYAEPAVTSLFAGSKPPEMPTIAIATQTIEVGADFDFDALVTQSAPIDVLAQRFGRLDRLGNVGDACGTIVHVEGDGTPDAIYGPAIAATMKLLKSIATAGELDFGVLAFEAVRTRATDEMRSEVREGEPLVAPHIERLAQTWTAPYDSPDVAAFLHGAPSDGDVAICWRRHLTEENVDDWAAHVVAAPPSSGEVVNVPLYAARAWMRLRSVDEADVPIEAAESAKDDEAKKKEPRRVFRLSPDDKGGEVIENAGDVVAGDTLVVPATRGGCDRFGWDPGSTEPVGDDLCEVAYFGGRRARLAIEGIAVEQDEDPDDVRQAALVDVAATDEDDRRLAIAELLVDRFADVSATAVGATTWFSWRARVVDDRRADETSLLRADVTLQSHSEHVRDKTRDFAQACGLPPDLVEMLAAAAYLHDVGKADLLFQAMLGNGVVSEEPLAKGRRGRVGVEKRLERLPRGYRHEATSVAMVTLAILSRFRDPALVRHLIGSHHGYGRPWFPLCAGPGRRVVAHLNGSTFEGSSAPILGRLDSGWVEQFFELVDRYGPWGLAYLEAILRLADWRCSEEEETLA